MRYLLLVLIVLTGVMPDAAAPVPGEQASSNPRQAAVVAPNPTAALDQYPDNPRISAAKATLDKVNQRYAELPGGVPWVKRMHNELTNRLARGAAIPNPQQAFGMIHRAMDRGGIGG